MSTVTITLRNGHTFTVPYNYEFVIFRDKQEIVQANQILSDDYLIEHLLFPTPQTKQYQVLVAYTKGF